MTLVVAGAFAASSRDSSRIAGADCISTAEHYCVVLACFLRWRVKVHMSPEERLGRRIIGSFVLGLFVAVGNFGLDRLFARMGAARDTNVLNDLLIGAAAALLGYSMGLAAGSKACLGAVQGKAHARSDTRGTQANGI